MSWQDGFDDEWDGVGGEIEAEEGPPPDTESLLRALGDIVAAARPMPLSSSVVIHRDEVLDLVDEALERLPEELRAARWLVKEREDYLARVKIEGEEMLDAARSRVERMVQKAEVVKSAEQRGRRIVQDAEDEARRLRLEAEDFVDQRLASFEIVLERTARQVRAGREKLSGPPLEVPEPPPPEPEPVFDQERG